MSEKHKSFRSLLVVVPLLLAFIYAYPRILLKFMDPGEAWMNYLYHYGFGVVFFGVGMTIMMRSGACKSGRGYDSHWIRFLVGGLIAYMSVHAVWILLAHNIPFLGE